MNNSPLQTQARQTERSAAALRGLALALADHDDAALNDALVAAARDRDEGAFTHLLLAAFHAGRRVDAGVLVDGAALLSEPDTLTTAAVHCAGDVGVALLEAVRGGRFDVGRETLALALCGWWSREVSGSEIPAEAIRRGRMLARIPGPGIVQYLLPVLSDLAGDPHLAELLPADRLPEGVAGARKEFDGAIERARKDPLGCLRAGSSRAVLSGYTVRRAVARVGRNAPCPCGSGKKYKRCCFEQDRDRLRHSSDVEGLTIEELHDNPEPHITRQRLDAMSPNQLARLDAARIDPALLSTLVHRLTMRHEFEAVIKLFDAVGWRDDLDGFLLDAVDEATELGLADSVRRLLAIRGDRGDADDQLRLGTWILAEGVEPGPLLRRIESEALRVIDRELGLIELAHDLLSGPCPALGILVARGVLWVTGSFEGQVLLHRLLETRDRLDIAPLDLVEDLAEESWSLQYESGEDPSDVSDATRHELEAKLAETRHLRAELRERDRVLQDMDSRLQAIEAQGRAPDSPQADAHAHAHATRDDDAMVASLRRKLAARKQEVTRKHAERNELRVELKRAREEVEALRARARARTEPLGRGPEQEALDHETLLLPEQATEKQPPRLPRFRKHFEEHLRRVPTAVAGAALRLVGRLAAGDLSAFQGSRRLSTNRELWRQRVGSSYRLLFRLEPDALVVLGLVTRQDFPRFVRSL